MAAASSVVLLGGCGKHCGERCRRSKVIFKACSVAHIEDDSAREKQDDALPNNQNLLQEF